MHIMMKHLEAQLKNHIHQEMLIGKIDVEEAAMEEEMKFTFGGVELLDKFNQM